ncbi:uncharacterized protein LOC110236752 [Exaiptasia diaphana]|uniref:Uncharacterized protein n=1 Tax=Exaiptasia diaphana TaxID=2652724 RepID=A0A913YGI6_EXADI|nr:uncharacterized protein LOC110236752 [Exaiptasia diaphana]XP_028514178.1 uncharacterized protein LOC110236752 [Exaiptasia diaphana]XP_028514179.1 uncharacterized protein LOC110236752 [Exaiptasia diaphana]XP_028514180.1 uncharacterized protein LOC110236752 [Exaiptasia diaphana]KXJ15892.1 hypothetical protein AC249_AIPGENE17762 [Exaiptasia diaphana]
MMSWLTTFTAGLLATTIATTLLSRDTKACTSAMDYEASCRGCVSQLVQSWKAHPKANCSEQYSSLQRCLTTNKEKCLNTSPKPDNRTVHDIQQLFAIYSASELFFCQNGMLLTLTNYKPSDLNTCTPALFKKAETCAKKFLKRFSRNRGSPKLCRWYYKARKCMAKAINRNCKTSSMTSYLKGIYEESYNPYCKNSQDIIKKRVRKGSSGFGRCTKKSYLMKSRRCIVRFIHELQKKNGQRCRSIVSSVLIPCVKHCMKRCLKGTRDTKSLDKALTDLMDRRRNDMQNDNCEGSHLETLTLSKEQCSEEYFENFQGRCNSKFLALYKKNRGDPQLCQHYSDVKRCARNMTLSMCKLDSAMKYKVHDLYGSFNPFCPNGRDPPKSSSTYEQFITPLKNNVMAYEWSVSTMVTSIFVLKQLLS